MTVDAVPQFVAASIIEMTKARPWFGQREGLLDELYDEVALKVTFDLGRPPFYQAAAALQDIGLMLVTGSMRPAYRLDTSPFPLVFTREIGKYSYEQVRTTNLRSRFPLLFEYARQGAGYLEGVVAGELLNQIPGEGTVAPASDRIVEIDHNSPAVQTARDGVATALRRIEDSNSFARSRNDWVTPHIGLGLQLLKQKRVVATAITALLLQPLYAAYSIIAEDAARAAILAAIEAIKAAFGL